MKGVYIEFGETRLQLAFTNAAQVEYEDRFDESFLKVAERFSPAGVKEIRITYLRNLFGLALRAHNPEVTDTLAGEIIDEIGLGETLTKIGQAIEAAFPAAKGDGGKPGNGRAAKAA